MEKQALPCDLYRAGKMQSRTEVPAVSPGCGSEPLRDEGVGRGFFKTLCFNFILF